ncbi:MAG TPA: hypothetical protein VIV58_12005 [Kofleriaceae bacterium]
MTGEVVSSRPSSHGPVAMIDLQHHTAAVEQNAIVAALEIRRVKDGVGSVDLAHDPALRQCVGKLDGTDPRRASEVEDIPGMTRDQLERLRQRVVEATPVRHLEHTVSDAQLGEESIFDGEVAASRKELRDAHSLSHRSACT